MLRNWSKGEELAHRLSGTTSISCVLVIVSVWTWEPYHVSHRDFGLPELIATEKEERKKLVQFFQWPAT